MAARIVWVWERLDFLDGFMNRNDRGGSKNGRDSALSLIASVLDRNLYKLQQRSLALSTGLSLRLWQTILHPDRPRPSRQAAALLEQRYSKLVDQDLDNVAAGYYPRGLLYDFPLWEYLTVLPEAIRDMPRIMWRRYQGQHQDLPADVDRSGYPRYYLQTFHWQTDGWLSERSARLYDAGVEFLFAGTADVMRRMAIPAIVEAVAGKRRPRILDIGCGTGRFLRTLRKTLPQAKLYGLDLSPQYLQRAHQVLGTTPDVSLVAENAEKMPFADRWFDVVTSVFMFHELPSSVRRRITREVRRVLKPGGRFVVCDSVQLVDSPDLKDLLSAFPTTYHEPYYARYLADDLAKVVRQCGFTVESSAPWLVSKVVVARRGDGTAKARPKRAPASHSASARRRTSSRARRPPASH